MSADLGRRVATAAAIIAAAVGMLSATGCGGSKKPAPRLTKAQYISRANAVCQALLHKFDAVNANAKAFRLKVEELVKIVERTNAQLRAIPMPAPDKVPSEWLHWREVVVTEAKAILKAKPGSPASRAANVAEFKAGENARRLATAYGLPLCAPR